MAKEIQKNVCTLRQIAFLLKRSERRIQQYVREGILPRAERGKYNIVECVHGLIDYQDKQIQGQGHVSLLDERARLLRAQAELEEIKLAKEKEKLIDRDALKKIIIPLFIAIRSKLLSWASKLPSILFGKDKDEISEELDKEVREVLTELSSGDIFDDRMLKNIQAAAETDGQ